MRFFGLAVLIGLVAAGTASAQEGKDRPRGGAGREEMLKKYDENKDGKLDETERKKATADRVAAIEKGEIPPFLLQRFDEDKDGKLSDGEKSKLLESVKSGRGQGGPGGRGGEEFQKRLLERFDANKDGKLDDAEKAKARESRPEGGKKRRPAENKN